jgi:hypothetical protein
MHRGAGGAAYALLIAGALSVGCSSTASSPNSFTNVYGNVLAPNCTNAYCHFNLVPQRWSGLDLSNQVTAYWGLVNHLPEGAACNAPSYGLRVLPYSPENSILYQKVSMSNPPCGAQMPTDPAQQFPLGPANPQFVFSGQALSPNDQQLIYNWIKEGALNN